ncbi:MAG: ABC-type transport auxiliary lipoprotein family protein [Pseudomonadota bacterium]
MKLRLCSIVLIATLGGCSGILTSEEAPLREYWLFPEPTVLTQDPRLKRVAPSIAISAPRGMDRRELLHLESTGQLKEYASARWTDSASVIVANYLGLALERATGIVIAGNTNAVDATLDLELRELYTRRAASGDEAVLYVVSTITCEAKSTASGGTLTSPVRSEQLAAVVAAHRANFDALSRSVKDQLVATCGDSPD